MSLHLSDSQDVALLFSWTVHRVPDLLLFPVHPWEGWEGRFGVRRKRRISLKTLFQVLSTDYSPIYNQAVLVHGLKQRANSSHATCYISIIKDLMDNNETGITASFQQAGGKNNSTVCFSCPYHCKELISLPKELFSMKWMVLNYPDFKDTRKT